MQNSKDYLKGFSDGCNETIETLKKNPEYIRLKRIEAFSVNAVELIDDNAVYQEFKKILAPLSPH